MLPVIGLAIFSPTRVYKWFIFSIRDLRLSNSLNYLERIQSSFEESWVNQNISRSLFFISPSTPVLTVWEGIRQTLGRAGHIPALLLGECSIAHQHCSWAVHVEFLFFTEHWLHQAPSLYRHLTIKELTINTLHRIFCAHSKASQGGQKILGNIPFCQDRDQHIYPKS